MVLGLTVVAVLPALLRLLLLLKLLLFFETLLLLLLVLDFDFDFLLSLLFFELFAPFRTRILALLARASAAVEVVAAAGTVDDEWGSSRSNAAAGTTGRKFFLPLPIPPLTHLTVGRRQQMTIPNSIDATTSSWWCLLLLPPFLFLVEHFALIVLFVVRKIVSKDALCMFNVVSSAQHYFLYLLLIF